MKLVSIVSLAFLLISTSISATQLTTNVERKDAPLFSSLNTLQGDKNSNGDDDEDDGDVIYYPCYVNPASCYK